MKTLKIRQLLSLVFSACFYGFISGVDLDPCFPAVINGPCNMTCRVPNTLQLIKINCNGNTQGSCSTFGCTTNMFQEGGNTVFLEIRSLSYSDTCNWTCSHGSDTSLPSELTVFSGFYKGDPSLTYQRDGDLVKLTATAECVYPSNLTVNVQYKDQGGEYLDLPEQQVILQYSNVPGVCGFAYENRTTAKSDVSGKLKELDGKRIFFKMRFSQYDSAILPYYSNEVGPISFEELTKKKVFKACIIVAFIVVAIIIGLCLGLLIEGICDKIPLALSLSFAFAILLPVVLFVILFYYHKFESKKDFIMNLYHSSNLGEIQDGSDGGAQDGNGKSPKKTGSTTNKNTREKTGESKNNTGSNTTKNATERGGDSQNNTGSNATKTATERVGSPASTSNIELAAKNKAGVPKGEQSALKQKEINTPLPQPPSGNSQYLTASTNNLPVPRNNQLDPIVMENEEANPSERKKKKRKKKKRKNEKNADEAGDNEDEN